MQNHTGSARDTGWTDEGASVQCAKRYLFGKSVSIFLNAAKVFAKLLVCGAVEWLYFNHSSCNLQRCLAPLAVKKHAERFIRQTQCGSPIL
jgi:hypothetical protein